MKIVAIETNRGTLTITDAWKSAKTGAALNAGLSQVVMGVYEDGRKTSLKWKGDGFYYMSGNFCSEAVA